jgi:hypothetical protein
MIENTEIWQRKCEILSTGVSNLLNVLGDSATVLSVVEKGFCIPKINNSHLFKNKTRIFIQGEKKREKNKVVTC